MIVKFPNGRIVVNINDARVDVNNHINTELKPLLKGYDVDTVRDMLNITESLPPVEESVISNLTSNTSKYLKTSTSYTTASSIINARTDPSLEDLLNNLWKLKVVNIRDAADDKHKTVDDTPYGGGSGMLLKADVLAKSLDENKNESGRILYLSPKGKKFDQNLAKELANEKSLSLICGHFEGVDERILSTRNIEEISIGDYVLSGGESAAYVVIDSILRLLPGVLGNENSKLDETFENGLLEYPQYTKPQIWEEKAVPDVLLSGDHNKIKHWRLSQSEAITRVRRPDLWEKYKKN